MLKFEQLKMFFIYFLPTNNITFTEQVKLNQIVGVNLNSLGILA